MVYATVEDVISIHAPRVGSDPLQPHKQKQHAHFYPRSPRGERPTADYVLAPGRIISIHAPRVGSDSSLEFQICSHCNISIHAPRVGSDRIFLTRNNSGVHIFLSTLPAWGATNGVEVFDKSKNISIHAPRVGSDRSA